MFGVDVALVTRSRETAYPDALVVLEGAEGDYSLYRYSVDEEG